MNRKQHPFLFKALTILAMFFIGTPVFAGITFDQNQAEIVIAPTCNHVPIHIPYTPSNATYDESLITVSSDSSWVTPSLNSSSNNIDLTFSTENLISSYTATLLVNDGEKTTELFIQASVSPLDIYRLLDDPLRSTTYGIQRNGIYKGSIVAFDPVLETVSSCITVGKSPTDFVINDDSSELFVINSIDKSIDVINLDDFSIKETISLPVYEAWGDAEDTTANIDLGPNGVIYYSDGAWAPILHVLKRSSGEVLESVTFNGSNGFMDFAVSSDKKTLVAMPQYGWSAGSHSPLIGQFAIYDDGTVNFTKETSVANFSREPFEAPVLLSDDDKIVVMKTIATEPSNTDNIDRVFPSAIWSMNANASVVATGDKLYEYITGKELYSIPGGSTNGSGYTYTKAQAFTSDFTRFVYFNASNRTLNVVNLIDEIGFEILGRLLTPADGSVINTPEKLTWTPLPAVDQYDLYLGTNEDAVAGADNSSDLYLGRITSTSFGLAQSLTSGTDYYWRIDPVTAIGLETGTIYSFTVSDIELNIKEIDVQTVAGHADYQVEVTLFSEESGISWDATAADSWVTLTENSGATPSTLAVQLDTSTLTEGFHQSTITLTVDNEKLNIPITLQVDPLNVTHIRSDKNSAIVYAISEDTSGSVSSAYLLEIDAESEKIQRVVRVGSSVTDFTIHYPDNLIYVTNWKSGNLLAIDKSTFEHSKSIAFQPAGATGYGDGDVYRVAAGVSERIIVEEEDQWIDISLFNSNLETELNQTFVREGGGAFDPSGRYYYHGENNSSGASIIKFDTSGDTFTNLAEVRPDGLSSSYGSRTVVVSEDGSKIFWAGAVLDQDLNSVWSTGETIYSVSTNGRYAFAQAAIYDVNLRRQVFTMPANSTVSGYNTVSGKFITQVNEALGFYILPTSGAFEAPVLSVSNSTDNAIDLSWTDKSLEMEFYIQHRLLGSESWLDVHTTQANITDWTNTELEHGTSYEFRVRAGSADYSSPWSNVAIKRENDVVDVLGRMLNPANNAIINTPNSLNWISIPWIDEYDIYLGTDENTLISADTSSTFYLGRINGTSVDLTETLSNDNEYFWRIDPITELGPETGQVYSFNVSEIALDVTKVEASTFVGHEDFQVDVQLTSLTEGVAWTVEASEPWITFTENTGSTPSTLSVHLDATKLVVGTHDSIITLTSETSEVQIPVKLTTVALNITHIRSDRNSSTVYAISEDSNSDESSAYLLEIDSSAEKIQRVIQVGSYVTDIAIHYTDNLIYVTNWQSGELLAIDKTTFELTKKHIFQPAGATGYGEGDVYRIAAGASERLVVEEEDQWIDISLYNTKNDTKLSSAFVREGGGAFGPLGRYYYHGESNSSGASIIKFDTSGDTFTNLVEVRPDEISNYYGSRTVVVSEDGSRIFWAGVALNQNLETEWGVNEVIYSTSTDGRYAFGKSTIYDINLKRQVLTMPLDSLVSGYNSTSEKLITPVNGVIKFYSLTSPLSLPAPALNVKNPTYNSVDLEWTDNSLEMTFTVQQKVLNSDTWVDIINTDANTTSLMPSGLADGLTYEFRVRASSTDYSSPWSNIVLATLPERPNVEPVAINDIIGLSEISVKQFNITQNDRDSDGEVIPNSIVIVTAPKFGNLVINTNGEVTYTPADNFVDGDFFSYTIEDNDMATSQPASVTLILAPTPTLNAGNVSYNSVDIHWTTDIPLDVGVIVQIRQKNDSTWYEVGYSSANVSSWTIEFLPQGVTYDFRVSANYQGDIAPWSNIVTITTPTEIVAINEKPIANNDVFTLTSIESTRFSVTNNDSDSNGTIDTNSIEIITGPQFGQVLINSGGEITYVPDNGFIQQDSFSYTIKNNNGESSSPATVSLIYMPIPVLSISNLVHDGIEVSWESNDYLQLEYVVQQRVFGTDSWVDVQTITTNISSWNQSNISSGVTYEFRIRAIYSDYTSLWSNIAVAKAPSEPEQTAPTSAGGSDSSSSGGSLDIRSLILLLSLLLIFRKRHVFLGRV
jgi:6-phosphogluconolactonase (cycloisomerase 2 family)